MKDNATIGEQIARMALGYDKYELVKGKAEVFPAKESTDYVDSLVAFHKDAMKFLRSLNVYSTSDRLETAKQINALLKQGDSIEDYD
jgi:hypothetical protein